MSKYKVEICANSVQSCIEAEIGGACRVELCAGIPEGGTTPSYATIKQARENIKIKLNVIIRPRGGDFLYSALEQENMIEDIKIAKKLGADGVVFGCLKTDGGIDISVCKKIIEAANGMDITFHRAFDLCSNPQLALEQIIDLGCSHILTSGQQPNAELGIEMIKKLIEQADNRIVIMPGCGIRVENVLKIAQQTGAYEFHTSAKETFESAMIYRKFATTIGKDTIQNEYQYETTDRRIVAQIVEKLNKNLKNI